MITPEDTRTLFAYDAWANRRMLDACAALAPEHFTRDLGSSFRSVRDTMAHIHGAQWIWFERFHGRSPALLPNGDPFPDVASLRARWTQFESELLSYINGLSAADLETLAARLKKRCGSGGTVRQGVIEIQGEHRDTLVAELGKLGWPAKKSGG